MSTNLYKDINLKICFKKVINYIHMKVGTASRHEGLPRTMVQHI